MRAGQAAGQIANVTYSFAFRDLFISGSVSPRSPLSPHLLQFLMSPSRDLVSLNVLWMPAPTGCASVPAFHSSFLLPFQTPFWEDLIGWSVPRSSELMTTPLPRALYLEGRCSEEMSL